MYMRLTEKLLHIIVFINPSDTCVNVYATTSNEEISMFSRNSEANASEFLENIEEIFPIFIVFTIFIV